MFYVIISEGGQVYGLYKSREQAEKALAEAGMLSAMIREVRAPL